MTAEKITQLKDFYPGSQFRQYQLIEQIGFGGIGLVWSALDQIQNSIVAIKLNEVDPDNMSVNYLMLDRHFTGLHHPHVMPTYDFGVWENIQYIVTPYIPGGSLEDRLNSGERLPLAEALRYAYEISSALDYLHQEQVVHRDLKPANVLINSNHHLYVADFDLARILSKTTQSMHTGRGTPAFAPPEQHAMTEVTPQSDIFSLGVVFYQMFAEKLPWNGERSLGIQQLSSRSIELPDPREVKPELPARLVDVLRKMTAVNAADRPASAGEALQMVYDCFDRGLVPPAAVTALPTDIELRDINAEELLKTSLAQWEQNEDSVIPTLTKFAVVDLKYRPSGVDLPSEMVRFMLANALTYGYQTSHWWKRVKEPFERIAVSSQLMNKYNDVIAERIINHLENDREILTMPHGAPQELINSLLSRAYKTKSDELREKIFTVISELTESPASWRETAFSAQDDSKLAALASQEGLVGEKAAMLIGHIHSESAAMTVLKTASPARRASIFQTIQMTAGSLPVSVPFGLRIAITGKWLQQIVLARPNQLLMVFIATFLGTLIGTGIQTFISYRLPSFLDVERIIISLEHGGFLGMIFGLGILMTRIIAERFSSVAALARILLATAAGGIILNMGLFTYNVLFLKYFPTGFVLTAGCLLIALGFATGSFLRTLTNKSALAALFISVALAGSWWYHTQLASTPLSLAPIFFYEYTWTNVQVLACVFLVAIPMAVMGSLFNLTQND